MHARRPLFSTLSALVALACTSGCMSGCTPGPTPGPSPRLADTSPSATAALPPPPARDDGRLPSSVRPTQYDLSLRIDPSKDVFSGRARIEIDINEPVGAIVLHGPGLTIAQAVLLREGLAESLTPSLRTAGGQTEPDELVLAAPMTIPAGKATLDLTFSGKYDPSLRGLYRMKDGDLDYAFTQFEPTDARRAFPCFDEPGFKAPVALTVEVPKGQIAIANGPEKSREPIEGGAWIRFGFATTPPIPTYLVALGVGELDVLAGPAGKPPIRIVATKGKAKKGAAALTRSRELLTKLETYFGIEHPFAKLDVVAVPEFSAGAMENPGFVTFREELVLLDPTRSSLGDRRRMDGVITHEFAHQWFGNLVTARWWDDLWLNEGFATWAESKGLPEMAAESVNNKMGVMETDVLASARAVRQPVRNNSDALEAFDGVTYVKGAAILTMLEAYAGPEKFRTGVQKYLRANANGNASAADFLSQLDTASGLPISKVASTFLDRTGVPLVRAELRCDGAPSIHLSQMPFPRRGKAPSAGSQWTVPVCVAVGDPRTEVCTLLDGPEKDIPLTGKTCPTWFFPNANESGYFRYAVDKAGVDKLAATRGKLTPVERVALVGNEWALVRGGVAPLSALISVLRGVSQDGATQPGTKGVVLRDRYVVDAITDVLFEVGEELIEDADRAAFATLVHELLGPTIDHLGWAQDGVTQTAKGRAETSDDLTTVREKALMALAYEGNDDVIETQARLRADAYLKNDHKVSPENGRLAMRIAARHGDAALFDAIEKVALHGETAQDRTAALRALGAFEKPELLRRALALTLTDGVKIQDVHYIYRVAFGWKSTSAIAFAWLQESFDKVKVRLPGFMIGRFAEVAAKTCSSDVLKARLDFLTPKLKDVDGTERELLLAKDGAEACIDLKAHEGPNVKAALKK